MMCTWKEMINDASHMEVSCNRIRVMGVGEMRIFGA
jgi:hypothetical protein